VSIDTYVGDEADSRISRGRDSLLKDQTLVAALRTQARGDGTVDQLLLHVEAV
jgi:hypothetical protein